MLMSARMVKTVTADVLAKQMKVLQDQLFHAKVHYDIYMALSKAWRQHIREMRNSPVFWQFTMSAHSNAAIVYLCRAYDSNETALHLSAFVATVERSPGLFSEQAFRIRHKDRPGMDGLAAYPRTLNLKQLSEDRDFCSRKNPLVANLRRWRNNVVAHFNYEEAVVTKDPMHKRHPLPWVDIKTLIDEG